MRMMSHVVTSVGVATLVILGASSPRAIAQTLEQHSLQPGSRLAQASETSTANLLFVNPTLGNDANNGTSQQTAFKSITQALQVAQPNTVILLTAGTYSEETGERFPLNLKPGVTIQGDPGSAGRGILIRGGGAFLSPTFASQNVAIVGANQAVLTGVTVMNPNPRGYGLWIESSSPTIRNNTFTGSNHDGISITGSSSPLVQSNTFQQNGANGITIYGTSRPEIRDNVFENTGFGINVAQNAAPLIAGNQIRQNQDGLVLQANARPTLRNNTIEGNRRDGLVAIAQSLPDLGTADNPGNNVFRDNGRHDINATASRQTIPAFGNQLTRDRTTGRIDLAGTTPIPAPIASEPETAPSTIGDRPPTATSTASINTPPRSPSLPAPATASRPASNPATPQRPTATARVESIEANPRAAAPAPRPLPNLTPGAIEIPVTPPVAPSRTAPQSSALNAPIDIPVQPPATNRDRPAASSSTVAQPAPAPVSQTVVVSRPPQPSSARPATNIARSSATANSGAIEIPVPLPETARSAPPTSVATQPLPTAPTASRPSLQSDLLPVPGGNIPLGNIGNLPTVQVSNNSLYRMANVSTSSFNQTSFGVRYRVLVEAEDEYLQAQVRSLVPGAFRTYERGRAMMQAGAFGDRTNADETANMLNEYGFRTLVQAISQ